MAEKLSVDLCIIGAGSGGLSVAAGAAQLGATVALIEHKAMGGDCLNAGCVPSKSLIAASRIVSTYREASAFGIDYEKPHVDFKRVHDHIHQVMDTISVNDSIERFQGLGVQVILEEGHFIAPDTIQAGNWEIKARTFVVATGSSPALPEIAGLKSIPYLTNETIFSLRDKPSHLLVIGSGPIGCEIAQAYSSLGVDVTILGGSKLLARDDPELVEILRQQFVAQNIKIHLGSKITQTELLKNKEVQVTFEGNGSLKTIKGSHLLIATGRQPNVQSLALEKAGVNYSSRGIQVNDRLQTSNKRIYAMGDVIGGYQFTHISNYHASIILKNALFKIPAKANYRAIPWVTYTDPELAFAGLSFEEALKVDKNIKVIKVPFSENDRAQTERQTKGMLKVIATAKGKVLGVSILGSHAGELLLPWLMLIQKKRSLRDLTDLIVPYPTLSEIHKKAASLFYQPLLFSAKTKRLIKFLRFLG